MNLNRWDLWSPDEPRYAQVAKEMVNGGDWLLMHYNGKTYGHKPPFFFWLIGLSSYVWGGFTSFAARFPAALFGTLTVVLTFFFGRGFGSSRSGFLSGLVLATSFEFAYLATRANIDTTLTFFTTTSIFCFFRWYRGSKDEKISYEPMQGPWFYGFYMGMALATLTKGPVGFVLPLLVSLIYLIFQKDWKGIKGMRLLPGMLLSIGIVLCWYLPAVFTAGETYLNETLFHQTFDRFFKGTSHFHPFYFYFLNFPLDFLPWFLFLPGAIVYGFSTKGERIRKEFLFLFIWFVSIFLFFSISKGKRAIYLLPLYPATSLLVGRLWSEHLSGFLRNSFREKWISIPIYLLIIFVFFAGMVLYSIPAVANSSFGPSSSKILGAMLKGAKTGNEYLSYVPRESIFPLIILLFGSGIILSLSHVLKFKSGVFIFLVATVAIGFFYGIRFIFPLINPYKSDRFISQEIRQVMKPGEKLGVGGLVTGPYNFYTGIVPIIELESMQEIIDFLHTKERVFCLLKYRDYEKLRRKLSSPNLGISLHMITRRRVGGSDLVLVANR
jgi:4-amino-4-deoxy-L-arabinose transferase-like glycosyltransferase